MSDAALSELDVGELRRRLQEAEETIRAIREGEVDALVIGGGAQADEEVFFLEGSVESYRAFMESMETGAAALDADGRLVYANAALCELLGVSFVELQASGLLEAFGAKQASAVRDVISSAGGERRTAQIAIGTGAGEAVLLVSAAPLRLGPTMGVALTFADLTERVRAAAAAESERTAQAILTSANEAVVVCDEQGVITHFNSAAAGVCAGNPVGSRFAEVIPLAFPAISGLMASDDLIELVVSGTPIQGVEAHAPSAPRAKDLMVSAAPLMVAGEATRGCVVTMVDLTQRKLAERQQQLLMMELDHRVRNTLTLVISICSRTASKEDTVAGFQRAFTGRIHALAATHKLLSDKSWSDLTLREIVIAELSPYTTATSRVDLRDLDVAVSARSATALGLIFHELTTNAVKYGALSISEGCVEISAARTEAYLEIMWKERSGPPVGAPKREGFGRTVISRSLSFTPDSGAEITFEPDGVRCRMTLPATELA